MANNKSPSPERVTVFSLDAAELRRHMDAQRNSAREMGKKAREIRKRAIKMRKRSEESRRKSA